MRQPVGRLLLYAVVLLSGSLLAGGAAAGTPGTALSPGIQPNPSGAGALAVERAERDRTTVRGTCQDFLAAQGTANDPPQFFPPVRDYVGWTDGDFTTFALVDYAGLANAYIRQQNPAAASLGTRVDCVLTRAPRPSHIVRYTALISTTRALAFAQSIAAIEANNFDFLATPTIFGATAQDVVNKEARPAAGPAVLEVSFDGAENAAPDLLTVINSPCTFAPVGLRFSAQAQGTRTDGSEGVLVVREQASLGKAACEQDPNASLVFKQEVVKIVPSVPGD